MLKLLYIIASIVAIPCFLIARGQSSSNAWDNQKDLSQLFELMIGEFSSADQAKEDSSFYNINLVMYPIWENDTEAKWLYVEQAVTEFIDKPYRQRVYRVSMADENTIESRVYTLNNPEKYIHAWDNPELFGKINPDSLTLRNGCAVFLEKDGNCFSGSTNEKDCESTLRGATYATSKVRVCDGEVISWDQGWDANDEQVWGAEKEGYIFKRKQ